MIFLLMIYVLGGDGSFHLAKVEGMSSQQHCAQAVRIISKEYAGRAVGHCERADQSDMPKLDYPQGNVQ